MNCCEFSDVDLFNPNFITLFYFGFVFVCFALTQDMTKHLGFVLDIQQKHNICKCMCKYTAVNSHGALLSKYLSCINVWRIRFVSDDKCALSLKVLCWSMVTFMQHILII